MFSTVLQELKGSLGRAFAFSAFFPVLMFTGASLAMFLEVTQGLNAALTAWGNLPALTQSLALLAGVAVVVFLAYLLYNFQYTVTRLFEGYWGYGRLALFLRNRWVRKHQKRWERLNALVQSAATPTQANEIIAEQLAFYPPPNHLDKMMPTRLGNILRAAEIYAYDRYGIDASVIWPRLRPLLKPEAVALLEDKKTALELMLLMALLGGLFTVLWAPVAWFAHRWDLFLLSVLGLPLSWLCYQNAVQVALAYGEQVKATFDLYRHDLLRALHRPIPSDGEAERKEWLRLSRFFYRNLPLPPSPPASPQADAWSRLANALADYLEQWNASHGLPRPERKE